MLSNSSIQNQNVINSNNISGSSSGSVVCSSLTLTDGTNTTNFGPTNTTLNNLTVNGTTNFNQLAFMNSGGRVYSSSFMVNGTDFRVMDSSNAQGIQMFNSNVLGDNTTSLQGIGANSKFQINTRNATNQIRNLLLEYANHSQLQGTTGGIDCLNDTVNLFSSTTTPTISIAPTYPDNTTKIATTSFVSSAITSINPAITYPPTNSNTLNINNTISLTDGTTTNTLNQSDWTGTIKTVNTVANVTHFLNFSDSSATGQGNPQKTAGISCNPNTNTITASVFSGSATTVSITDSNLNITYYPTFVAATGNGQALLVDSITGPLTYNPQQQILTVNSLALLNTASSVTLGGSGGTTLTVNCGNVSFRNYNWVPTGTTNTMAILILSAFLVNGFYTVGILNNGSGVLTINKVLGGNNKTRFTSDVIVPAGGYAVMKIQVLSINSATMTIVDAYNVA